MGKSKWKDKINYPRRRRGRGGKRRRVWTISMHKATCECYDHDGEDNGTNKLRNSVRWPFHVHLTRSTDRD